MAGTPAAACLMHMNTYLNVGIVVIDTILVDTCNSCVCVYVHTYIYDRYSHGVV